MNVYFYEGDGDREAFGAWLERPRRILAVDCETRGLEIFSTPDFCRLVQFGDERASWVIPARHVEPIRRAVESAPHLVAHNAPHDLLTLDEHLGIKLEEVHHKTIDTRILSHIIDPRAKHEGGIGHGLKELSAHFLADDSADGQKVLKEVFKANKWRGSTGWSLIPEDHEDYVRYAGLDTILTARLYAALVPQMAGYERLSPFEHRLQRLLARMERRGVLVDPAYLTQLCADFDRQEAEAQKVAAEYGVLKVGSTAQIAVALSAMGIELDETTPTGKPKLDKAILSALVEQGNPLAKAVMDAKRARKWRTAYAQSMLDLRDGNDRVHAKLNSLQARTARMSVSHPAWQQLPSTDYTIRDGVIADEGQLIISSDYSQIEPKVVATLAGCCQLIAAAKAGADLYDATATMLYGLDFTKAQRKVSKVVYLAKVYFGGPATQARQTGNTVDQMRDANRAFDEQFPEIRRYGYQLQDEAKRRDRPEAITPILGRRLPLDEERLYAAVNYQVQSTARDIFAQSMLDLEDAGLEEHLILPVHDEVLGQAPADIAADVAKTIGDTMTTTFQGTPLVAEGEVYGPRWGDGYKSVA